MRRVERLACTVMVCQKEKCLFIDDRTDDDVIAVFVEAFRLDIPEQDSSDDAASSSSANDRCGSVWLSNCKMFLQCIAEPVSRTAHIHEYRVSPFSLGGAVSAGLTHTDVIQALKRFAYATSSSSGGSTDVVQQSIGAFVERCMTQYNRVAIVLRGDEQYLAVRDEALLSTLRNDAVLKHLLAEDETSTNAPKRLRLGVLGDDWAESSEAATEHPQHKTLCNASQTNDAPEEIAVECGASTAFIRDTETQQQATHYAVALTDHAAARIASEILCVKYHLPLCRVYNFAHDSTVRSVHISLKPQCRPRQYQIEAVQAAVSLDGTQARSGVLLLPCGAGKTLVGVLLASLIKKTTLIVCAGSVSVEQWKHQLSEWVHLAPPEVDEGASLVAPIASNSALAHSGRSGRRGGAAPPMRFASSIAQSRPSGAARIACLTGKQKDAITDDTDIVITTYTMLGVAHQHLRRTSSLRDHQDGAASPSAPRDRRASAQTKQKRNPKDTLFLESWGLLLLDEVHMAPAAVFRDSIDHIKAKCVVGLTATYVREDHKIRDIFHVVGPKLYDISWDVLCQQGYLAKVTCVEVRVPMTAPFLAEYTSRITTVASPTGSSAQHEHLIAAPVMQLIAAANPNKFLCTWELVHRHVSTGAKILVFCDHIALLKEYGALLGAPVVHGETPHKERLAIFSEFQSTARSNIICISRVGDVSVNLPCANVVIQVSSHGGSRRQEAQRLGRILRPKAKSDERETEAYFYSLVSRDTTEVIYASHRSEFLIDQGYTCRLVTFEPPRVDDGVSSETSAPAVTSEAVPRQGSVTAPSAAAESLVGDVRSVKREALISDLQAERRLTATSMESSLLAESRRLRDAYAKVTSASWQIGLLARTVARWEVQYQSAAALRKQQGAAEGSGKRQRRNSDSSDGTPSSPGSSEDEGALQRPARPTQKSLRMIKREMGAADVDDDVVELPPRGVLPDRSEQLLRTFRDDVVYHEFV